MTTPAALVETHVSVIVMMADRAYKVKKPVRLDFLDYSTRAAREAACHREVELNRRLAPDVYLGVADVHGPDGEVVDHLVVMRRMPDDRRLATLVAAGADATDATGAVRAVARAVASFHARADRSDEITAAGGVDAVRALWASGIATMEPFVGSLVEPEAAARVADLVGRYLDGRAHLFAARQAGGHVCDGHGDLQAADIFCLDDGPRILDCIDFDDRLRFADVVADVAFLAMDLERLGAPEVAHQFLDAYREFSAENAPVSLLEHFVAYRAHVRAKVACVRAAQGDGASVAEAATVFGLALDHLERARVALVVVGGAPGTGKSTVAVHLADARGWAVVRSDEVRKDLAGVPHDVHLPAGSARDRLYSDAMTAATYDAVLARAQRLLEAGVSVVVDATWGDGAARRAARALARQTSSELYELRCTVPPEVVAARVTRREAMGADASDATPEVARSLAALADPWPEATELDTTVGAPLVAEHALAAIGIPRSQYH